MSHRSLSQGAAVYGLQDTALYIGPSGPATGSSRPPPRRPGRRTRGTPPHPQRERHPLGRTFTHDRGLTKALRAVTPPAPRAVHGMLTKFRRGDRIDLHLQLTHGVVAVGGQAHERRNRPRLAPRSALADCRRPESPPPKSGHPTECAGESIRAAKSIVSAALRSAVKSAVRQELQPAVICQLSPPVRVSSSHTSPPPRRIRGCSIVALRHPCLGSRSCGAELRRRKSLHVIRPPRLWPQFREGLGSPVSPARRSLRAVRPGPPGRTRLARPWRQGRPRTIGRSRV